MGTLIGMATAKGEEFMPQQFVKRDGAVYPFREYKLELVFAALEVEDPGKVAAVTAARLTGKRVTAQQVEDAVLAPVSGSTLWKPVSGTWTTRNTGRRNLLSRPTQRPG